MLRLLLIGLAVFFGVQIFNSLRKPSKQTEVRGDSKNKPLELNEDDIDDVEFKELND